MDKNLVARTWLRKIIGNRAVPVIISLLGVPAAHATVVETLTTSSSYTYDFAPGVAGGFSGVGDNVVLGAAGSDPDQATEIRINNQTLAASDASFFFLQNIQCKGFCSVSAETQIVNTITNTGSVSTLLELQSNITPGHFGLVQNADTPSSGMFLFEIMQNVGGIDTLIYSAQGEVSSLGAFIKTSDGSVFSALTAYQDPAQIGLDWEQTALNFLLDPLAPGATTTLTYSARTVLNAYGICVDVTLCDGVQVAFGDPRNTGGIILNRAPALAAKNLAKPVGFVLDRGFDGAQLRLQVAEVPAVPEPSSWAMLIVGFGLVGVAARRAGVRLAGAGRALALD